MQKVSVKIPRKKQRLRIVRSQKYLDAQLEAKRKAEELELIKQTDAIEHEPEEVVIQPKQKRIQYTEYFTISDANQPIQISLKNIPAESITVSEAKIEIQRSYDKGFNDGKDTSDAEYKAEIRKYEDWIKRIDSVILEIKDKYIDEAKKFEEIIIDTALMIASEILNVEISKENEILLNQVKNAISSLEDDEIFSIHLNPEDIEVLENVKSNLTDDRKKMENVKLIPDRSVDKGGCIVRSAAGSIDARIKTQLQNAKAMLQKALEDQTFEESDFRETAIDLEDRSMKIDDEIKASDYNIDESGEDLGDDSNAGS
jgi:flagellar biosynthesis/type III secretory pathway protein FliH